MYMVFFLCNIYEKLEITIIHLLSYNVSIMTCPARMLSTKTEVYLINRPEAKPRDINEIYRGLNTQHPS